MQVTRQAQTVIDEFRWRGFIHNTDDGQELYTPGLEELLSKEKITGYIGFDPTADSLHVGNLVGIMALVHLQRHGHTPIAIAGGGTGLIGDPGGRSTERPLLTREQIEENLIGIKEQLSRFLDFSAPTNAAKLMNNADWLDKLNTIDFMRDIGKHFTISYMLAKESVQSRMSEGISYTEFSYMILQAYDFLTLFDEYNCVLQMGGSDQWGNITAGIELIRRTRGAQAHALVTPLITTASGAKFGKSEGNAVWLNAKHTSPFKFHQYWLNCADEDVGRYIKLFTVLTRDEIAALEESVATTPEKREAQRRLADEVTRTVHGDNELRNAHKAADVLFGGDISGIGASELLDIFEDVPSITLPRERLESEGVPLLELITTTGLAASRSEARRLVQQNAIALSGQRVSDVRYNVTLENAIDGQVLVLRRGAREHRLVRLEQ